MKTQTQQNNRTIEKKFIKPSIQAQRNKINGSYIISTMYKGYLVTRVFYGYSKTESINKFKEVLK